MNFKLHFDEYLVCWIGSLGEAQKHNLIFLDSLTQFKKDKSIKNFYMNKDTLFRFVDQLKYVLQKQNTKYCKVVFIDIHVCCVVYKIA
jgi:hypothetical protein